MPEELDNLILVESSKYVSDLWSDYQLATTVFRAKLNQWYKQYRGIPDRRNYSGMANVFVNETLGACESIVAQEIHALFSDPKYLLAVGREPTDEEAARLIEGAMFFYLDKMRFKSKLIRQKRQKVKYGTTLAQICWCYEENLVVRRGEDGLPITRKEVIKNHPDMIYLDIEDVALDPGKQDIEDMFGVVIRKRVSWDYIKDRERRGLYSSAQVAKIKKTEGRKYEFLGNKTQRLQSVGINYYAYDSSTYEILEYWGKVPIWWIENKIDLAEEAAHDLVPGVIEVISDGPTLRLDHNPYHHKEIPIVKGEYIAVDNEAYGIGVCEISESLQIELNDKRNQLLDHATEQIFPPLIESRSADIKGEIRMEPYFRIRVNGDPTKAIAPMRPGGNPGENVVMEERIKADIRNDSGATSPVRGIPLSKESTAFEISELASRGASRIDVSTIDFGEKFLKRTYRLIYKLIQQYVDRNTMIRIVGKNGVRWETLTPNDVAQDFDIIPKIPTDVSNRMIVRTQMIQFLAQVVPFYPKVDLYRLVRKIYDLFGFDDGEQVVPDPTPDGSTLSLEEEITVLTLGQHIEVGPQEDHAGRILALTQFLTRNPNLSPQALNAFKDKIRQHHLFLKANLQLQTLMAQSGVIRSNGKNRGSPEKPKQESNISPLSQVQRDLTRTGS